MVFFEMNGTLYKIENDRAMRWAGPLSWQSTTVAVPWLRANGTPVSNYLNWMRKHSL